MDFASAPSLSATISDPFRDSYIPVRAGYINPLHQYGHYMYHVQPLYKTLCILYRGDDKSLARPGTKRARKHVKDARDFNNIETRAVIEFFIFYFLQGKVPKEIHAILRETLACFRPGRAKNLSAPL